MNIDKEKHSMPEANQDSAASSKRDSALRIYASIAAAGALLFACIALFGGIYSVIGLLLPWLDLGHPGNLLRGLVRAAIALPIAAAVLVFHYHLLKRRPT